MIPHDRTASRRFLATYRTYDDAPGGCAVLRDRRPRPAATRALVVLLASVLGLGSVGCGDETDRPVAQPTPNVTTFEPGRFDDLPLFPRSDPIGPRHEQDGVVVRSYVAKETTPEQVLEFYQEALDARWTMLAPIERLGVGTYRADWVQGDYRLRISATKESTIESEDPSAHLFVQYSLTLTPV